jgi:hypothetical protein
MAFVNGKDVPLSSWNIGGAGGNGVQMWIEGDCGLFRRGGSTAVVASKHEMLTDTDRQSNKRSSTISIQS